MTNPSIIQHLAQLLDVGIAPIDACRRLLDIRPEDEEIIKKLRKQLTKGQTLANAIYACKLCNRIENEIIKVAENSGKLQSALRWINNNIEQRQNRTRQLRTRLLLPNFVMLLMVIINIFIALANHANLFNVIINSSVTIIILASSTLVLLRFAESDATSWLSLGWQLNFHNTSTLFRRYFNFYLFTLLYWQVEAGVNYVTGAKQLSKLIDSDSYQKAIRHYQTLLSNGNSVVNSLASTQLISSGELAQTLRTGEESGRMSQALNHYLILEQQRLSQSSDTIHTWIPRIYYLIIVFFGISFIF